MPAREQLADAAQRGINPVINLAAHEVSNALPVERELVASLGMEYINIPVIWTTPTKDGLDRFMDVLDQKKE